MWWILAAALAQEAAPEPMEATELVEAEPEQTEPVAVTPGLRSEVLDNGLRVSVYTDPAFPMVSSQIWVHVGGSHEGPEERGFAHMFEHMMFGGTQTSPKGDYERFVHRSGGSDNAYTSFDETVYFAVVPPAALPELLRYEADRFATLDVSAELLAREKKIVTEELRQGAENSPQSRLMVSALERLMNGHPYAHTPAGTKDDIAAATLELTRRFQDDYYRPANLHLVVSGPLPAEEVLLLAGETLGQLEAGGKAPPDVPPLHTWDMPEELVLRERIPPIKAYGLLYRLPPNDHPDQWALELLQRMLSGSMVDRFREELITERKQAIEAFTVPFQQRAGGALVFAAISLPFKGKRKAFHQLEQAVSALDGGDWLTEESLKTARRGLLLDAWGQRLTANAMASAIGTAYRTWGDPNIAIDRPERLEQVTLADIERVWRTWVLEAEPIRAMAKSGKPREQS